MPKALTRKHSASLSLDCIPCFMRNALGAARVATADPEVHEQIVREAALIAASWDRGWPAPAMSQCIHRRLRELTGVADPYRQMRRRFNELALELLPELQTQLAAAEDRLTYAVRLAIAGNVIDLGVNGSMGDREIRRSLQHVLEEPFCGDVNSFRKAVLGAERILYLADNTGEIVFDRLLIEQLPAGKVTVAVRGGPVLNDATFSDALFAGIHRTAEVIDNGSDAPGTLLDDCSPTFRERFQGADVIVAKGQGNFETLRLVPANIFFLLKIKCPVVGEQTGLEVGTQALIHGGDERACTRTENWAGRVISR